jgi:hypothetical protein
MKKQNKRKIKEVNIRTTYYWDKKTGALVEIKQEWQDLLGNWHNLKQEKLE